MTLSRQVAVYETGLIAYAVIGTGFAIFLYLWFRSVLASSDYFKNLTSGSPRRRLTVQVFMLTLSAALGAGWFMGIIALLIARTLNTFLWSQNRELSDEDLSVSDDLERIRSLFDYDDAAQPLIIAVIIGIRGSGAHVTRTILERILENWGAFLPEVAPVAPLSVEMDAEFDPSVPEWSSEPCPRCGCHIRKLMDEHEQSKYCANCGRPYDLDPTEFIKLDPELDAPCDKGMDLHDHPSAEKVARTEAYLSKRARQGDT